MVGGASPAAAATTGSASGSASGGGSGGSSGPTARERERERERERDPTSSGTHPRASLRLPGALDDAIMLDSESPMFPSVMWSDAAADEKTLLRPASLFDKDPAPTTRGDDARSDSDAAADAAADAVAVAAEEGDLWWDIRAGNGRNDVNGVEKPAGETTTREATPGTSERATARGEGGARSALDDSDARRDAFSRDVAEWQAAATALYVGSRLDASTRDFVARRPSSPSPPPPPPGPAWAVGGGSSRRKLGRASS